MLLCPDCRHAFRDAKPADCPECGWKLQEVDEVPILLSTEDRRSPLFTEYTATYERIAADDLNRSLQPSDYLAEQADLLASYLPAVHGMHVCEVGLGQGLLFDRLVASRPMKATAVDIAVEYLTKYAMRRPAQHGGPEIELVVANAETLPYEDEFNLVVASELFEHVLNLGDLLISLRRSLVTSGQLIVRVPYKEDLRQYARQNGCPYKFVHLRSFTREGLVDLMHQGGFEVRRVWLDGYFAGRPRRLPNRLEALAAPYRARLFSRRRPSNARLAARMLLEPVTLTGLFDKS
jgi:SAM-dependent methyltransferase